MDIVTGNIFQYLEKISFYSYFQKLKRLEDRDETSGLRRLFGGRENSQVHILFMFSFISIMFYRISKFAAQEVQAIHDLVVL